MNEYYFSGTDTFINYGNAKISKWLMIIFSQDETQYILYVLAIQARKCVSAISVYLQIFHNQVFFQIMLLLSQPSCQILINNWLLFQQICRTIYSQY